MNATLPHSLDAEITDVQQKIRSEPTDPKWRMGLFQRYCQAGRWQKSLEQLQAYARLFPAGEAFAYAYRVALQQEQVRERVFRGEVDPLLPEDAPEWLGVLASALKQECAAESLSAVDLRKQALQIAPASSGTLDDKSFEWIADADTRLGPVCEAIFNGQYQWIPYSRIESIRVAAPSSVCDLVWLSAGIKLWGAESVPALIPARYPLTEGLTDAHLRSALTTWEDRGNDVWVGCGVRILATSNVEKSLLDVRRIDFNPPA
ncbi:MAG: virulence protein SciE type [Burkholderiaceae bacterium]|jgi:type VI secretion system protein ImpE|nr:virulence protein SciE type [Burkholderiaceae bacterium]